MALIRRAEANNIRREKTEKNVDCFFENQRETKKKHQILGDPNAEWIPL